MGNVEAWLVHELAVVHEQVEVDLARAPSRPVANATELALDAEENVEELAWRQRRLDRGRAVQEARLVEHAHRIGLAQLRHPDDLDSPRLGQTLDRAAERLLARTEVRPETNVRARHSAPRTLDDDGRVLDGRVEHDVRLADPNSNPPHGAETA